MARYKGATYESGPDVLKKARWFAIAMADRRFVVKKTRDPRISGGRYAFGPYGTKKKACQVGSYQNYGTLPEGCS